MKRKKNTKNSKRSQKNSQLPKFVCTAKINIVCVFVVCMCVCITTLSLPSNSLQVKFPQKGRKLRYHIDFLFAFVCVWNTLLGCCSMARSLSSVWPFLISWYFFLDPFHSTHTSADASHAFHSLARFLFHLSLIQCCRFGGNFVYIRN